MIHILWLIFSGIKFQFALFYSAIIWTSPIMILETLIGGILSASLFSFLGSKIEKYIMKKFPGRFKVFSKKNRMLARVRMIGGIRGISFLSPILLGIPIGVLLCLTLTTDKNKIMGPMTASISFWIMVFAIMGYIIKIYSSN